MILTYYIYTPVINVEDSEEESHPKNQKNQQTEAQKRKAAFKKAVEEAERSTLILNLNLGRARIVNPDTISTNVTKALIAMAAAVEGEESGVPSNASIEAVDDIISVAKKMTLVGKFTKSVRNTKDKSLNGSYCTLPVKYEFADKGTKFFADEVLRRVCKAQLSIPYPTILREAIRQIVEEKKKDYPDHLIKVLVDTRRMEFRVSRRLTKDSELIRFPGAIPIPEECLDVVSRQIPDGFEVRIPGNTRHSRKDSAEKTPSPGTQGRGSKGHNPQSGEEGDGEESGEEIIVDGDTSEGAAAP